MIGLVALIGDDLDDVVEIVAFVVAVKEVVIAKLLDASVDFVETIVAAANDQVLMTLATATVTVNLEFVGLAADQIAK